MHSDPGRFSSIRNWCPQHPRWTLTLLTLAALLPFLSKPFNIDDPLFVWAAQQIHAHPTTPYGMSINWFGFFQPMWTAMQNPPLMSYYLAVAGFFGWSEPGLHLACLLPAVALVLGTWRLAQNFCRWPMFAALATLFVPGVLVSATTVMCDVLMLALWTWAMVFWVEGFQPHQTSKLWLAGAMMALTLLAKYNGLCLLPLLAAYGLITQRQPGRWCLPLLIPLATFCAYEWLTLHLYGQSHFLASIQFAHTSRATQAQASGGTVIWFLKIVNALTVSGGGFAIALFCLPWLWRRRAALWLAGAGTLLVALALAAGLLVKYQWFTGPPLLWLEGQMWFWTVGGVGILALATTDVWQKRDAASWLLFLWVGGVFAFAPLFYWLINARVLLPMAPAVALLIARRLERDRTAIPTGAQAALLACAMLSLAVAQADFAQASTTRKAAGMICARHAAGPGKLSFKGHWGFQYYMQSGGARPLDHDHLELAPDDLLAVQQLNTSEIVIAPELLELREDLTLPDFPCVATMNPSVGGGFYSPGWGPLPFAFGSIPPESFFIYGLKPKANHEPP